MTVRKFANRLVANPMLHESLRYTLAGFSTMIVLWTCFIVMTELFNLHYLVGINMSTFIAWGYAYFINKYFVFRNHMKKHVEHATKFVIIQMLFLGWTNLILYLFVGLVGINYLIVAAVNAFFLVILNYLCQRIFVFKTK